MRFRWIFGKLYAVALSVGLVELGYNFTTWQFWAVGLPVIILVELGHHDDKCSFDAIIDKYKVKDTAVLELAKIVRAADTGKMGTVPEATGLEAVMSGISIAAKDDHEAIAKASIVYDALYTQRKMKLIEEEFKAEIEKMDRRQRREFLRRKLME